MVLQAFIDDSYTANGTFVLGGYIAPAEAWAKFSAAWEPLLPNTIRGTSGKFRFKMSEMVKARPDRIAPFVKIIEDNVLATLWCKINISDLERAKERIWSDRLEMFWSLPSQPFWFCFSGLLGMFHEHRFDPKVSAVLPLNEKVDFYFDRRSASDAVEVAADWDEFTENQAKQVQSLFGIMPRFEDDEEFLPLQAADYWAWWVRNIYENQERLKKLVEVVFKDDKEKPRRSIPAFGYTFSEDQLVDALIKKVRSGSDGVGPDVPIYDAKHHPRPAHNTVKTLSSSLRTKIRRTRKKRQP